MRNPYLRPAGHPARDRPAAKRARGVRLPAVRTHHSRGPGVLVFSDWVRWGAKHDLLGWADRRAPGDAHAVQQRRALALAYRPGPLHHASARSCIVARALRSGATPARTEVWLVRDLHPLYLRPSD
jgi:hypothetical protein